MSLVESLVSLLILSAIGWGTVMLVAANNRNIISRNRQIEAFVKSIDTIERLRLEVDTVADLIEFANMNAVKVYAVGFGEVDTSSGSLSIVTPEGHAFSTAVGSAMPRIFRVETGGTVPNSKVTTIIRCN